MPAKRRNRIVLKDIANKPDQPPFEVSRYVVAIVQFEDQLAESRKLYEGLPTFGPIVSYIDELIDSIQDGVGWLQTYLAGGGDLATLIRDLRLDTAQGLQSALDNPPTLFHRIPARASRSTQTLCSDIEGLVDRLCLIDDIRKKGYQLYNVLIGAI